jgi:hypothetical protein
MLAHLEDDKNNAALQLLSRSDKIWKHCVEFIMTRLLFPTTIQSSHSAIEISPAD